MLDTSVVAYLHSTTMSTNPAGVPDVAFVTDREQYRFIPSGEAEDPDPYDLDDWEMRHDALHFVRDDAGGWSLNASYVCSGSYGYSCFFVPRAMGALLDELHANLVEDHRD